MSTVPIHLELPPETQAVLARAQAWPQAITRNLVRTLDRLNEETAGHIVAQRATGKGPFPATEGRLGVRTGRYRRAVRKSRAVVSGSGIESALGNNVKYAGAHERGFQGVVTVKAHMAHNAMVDVLQTRDGRQVLRWESFGERGAKTKVASGYVRVRAHQMKMNLPARAPIRRGIEDRLPLYPPALGRAIVAAFAGEGAP